MSTRQIMFLSPSNVWLGSSKLFYYCLITFSRHCTPCTNRVKTLMLENFSDTAKIKNAPILYTVPVINDGHANVIIVALPGSAAGCSLFLTPGVYVTMLYCKF